MGLIFESTKLVARTTFNSLILQMLSYGVSIAVCGLYLLLLGDSSVKEMADSSLNTAVGVVAGSTATCTPKFQSTGSIKVRPSRFYI